MTSHIRESRSPQGVGDPLLGKYMITDRGLLEVREEDFLSLHAFNLSHGHPTG